MQTTSQDPLGPIINRWTHLSTFERDRQASRIVGAGVAEARIERPDAAHHRTYARLIDAALAGDAVAVGWLVDTHRPVLLARGPLRADSRGRAVAAPAGRAADRPPDASAGRTRTGPTAP